MPNHTLEILQLATRLRTTAQAKAGRADQLAAVMLEVADRLGHIGTDGQYATEARPMDRRDDADPDRVIRAWCECYRRDAVSDECDNCDHQFKGADDGPAQT